MSDAPHQSTMIIGEVAASGAASGPAFVCACAAPVLVPRRTIDQDDVPKEMERFDAAVAEAARRLADMQQGIARQAGDPAAAIFAAHGMVLHDAAFRSQIATMCRAERVNVETAVEKVIDTVTATFDRMDNLHFRARTADFRDIGNLLLHILAGGGEGPIATLPEGSIIVTSEILPSLISQLERKAFR
jgi:phosphotransferase system enzyme I (PtsI)